MLGEYSNEVGDEDSGEVPELEDDPVVLMSLALASIGVVTLLILVAAFQHISTFTINTFII